MAATDYILNISFSEDEMGSTWGKEIAKRRTRRRVEGRIEDNLEEGMSYNIVDVSPKFEPLPKYSEVEVPVIIFGTPEQISAFSL